MELLIKEKVFKNKKELRISEYNKNLSEVKPLSNIVAQDESFTMLKLFSGLEYEKIIGFYIIHNKEKDKYFVGQSKGVINVLNSISMELYLKILCLQRITILHKWITSGIFLKIKLLDVRRNMN